MASTYERPVPAARPRRSPRPAPVAPKMEYLPGLDGLRAVAVVAVMLYHAQQNMPSSWMPGGFLGVEVFFVISGYLITLLLISEHQRTHRIDLRQFWVRRARRLLPALYALLVVTMGIVGLGGRFDDSLQEHVKDFRGMWTSAWFYVTNWYQIVAGLNYADQNGRPPLLRHLWSLAVEEQFYFFWPLVMIVVMRSFRHRLPAVGVVFLALSLGITVGTALAYQPTDVERANFLYLSTITRMSGLLLGAGLAIFWRPWLVGHTGARRLGRRFDLFAVVGLVVLALTHWRWHFLVEGDDGQRGYDLLFRGGFLVVGLATVLVILATTHPGSFIGQRLFAAKPLVWIGTRSYGLYLWHWPIFQLTRPRGDRSLLDVTKPDLDMAWLPALVVRLALTVAVTELSYRLIETPVRTGALGRWWRRVRDGHVDGRRVLAAAGTAAVLLVGLPAAGAFSADDLLEQQAECNRNPAACELTQDAGQPETTTPETLAPDDTGSTPATSVGVTVDPAVTDPAVPDTAVADSMVGAETTVAGSGGTPASPPDPADPGTVPAAAGSPLAIGDSVMLGAKAQLEAAGIRVDAKENRQFSKAVALIQSYTDQRLVGDVVIIALATNGPINDKAVDTLMVVLSDVPHVIFVTPQIAGKDPEAQNNRVLKKAAERYSNVSIVDWRTAAQDKLKYFYKGGEGVKTANDAYFWKDRIHLAPKGQKYYAQLIVEEIRRLTG